MRASTRRAVRSRASIDAIAVLVAACIASAASPSVAADAFGVEDLMRGFASVKESRATFVEKKLLASLDQPLESSGELVYVAPSRLERRTIRPKPETLIVDGDTLVVERGGTRRSISLASYPQVAVFTGSIRSTLAGDLAALKRDYRVDFDGTRERWRLTLLPSNPSVAALVSRVQLTGRDQRIEGIEVLQADGNRSVSVITPQPTASAPLATPR